MKILQLCNHLFFMIARSQRCAPYFRQCLGRTGSVGRAGAGQSHRRKAGHRLYILGVHLPGCRPIAEHCLNGGTFQQRSKIIGHRIRIEASDAPVMVQLASTSHSASPWSRISRCFAGISSRAGTGAPQRDASIGQNRLFGCP